MPNANQNLELKKTMRQALALTLITNIVGLGLNQWAYAAGAIQPPSCEFPPPPPPQVPYPSNLSQTPINAPAFPPPGSVSAPTGPGGAIQPPSCEQPPVPPPTVPYPSNLSQTPVNAPAFPAQPVKPFQPTNYGSIPFTSNQAVTVPGAGNAPGVGVPGNTIYGAPGTTTLLSPLVPGASFALPGQAAPLGALPPIGSGLIPLPVNPGMLLTPPTVVPWTNGTAGNSFALPTNSAVIPANQIDQQSNTVSMPYSNSTALPPQSWKANVPVAPSTPGADPGMLRLPNFTGGSSSTTGGPTNWAANTVQVPANGQLPNGAAPITRSIQRGSTNDFGLSQKTFPKKTNFGYRMLVSNGANGLPQFDDWQGQPGSTTTDFGVGVKGIVGKNGLAQTSYDAARPAEYPGGQNNTGNLSSTSLGNHGHNLNPKGFAAAQITNDLYGTPMINPNRKYTDQNGNAVSAIPLTTIAPY